MATQQQTMPASGVRGFAGFGDWINQFISSYMAGLQMKYQMEEHQGQQFERQMRAHQFDLEARKTKLAMEEADRNAALEQIKLMTGLPAPVQEMPPGQMGPPAPLPTPSIHVPGMGSVPGFEYRPQTMEDLLLAKRNELDVTGQAQAESQRAARQVSLPPEVAKRFGLSEDIGTLDSTALQQLPKQVNVPPTVAGPMGAIGVPAGGGAFDPEVLTVLNSIFGEKQATARTGMQGAASRDVARIGAESRNPWLGLLTGGGGPTPAPLGTPTGTPAGTAPPAPSAEDQKNAVLERLAKQVRSGQTGIRNLPMAMRVPVLNYMGIKGEAVQDPRVQAQLDSYIPARAALDQLEQTVKDYAAVGITDPVKKAELAYQLSAQRNAFARLVGRGTGEKGVFTDQDKADFARYINPGVIGTTVAPQFALSQIGEARGLMDRIQERVIGRVQQTTGGKVPGYSVGQPVDNLSALPVGAVIEGPDGRRHTKTATGWNPPL